MQHGFCKVLSLCFSAARAVSGTNVPMVASAAAFFFFLSLFLFSELNFEPENHPKHRVKVSRKILGPSVFSCFFLKIHYLFLKDKWEI